MTQIVLNVPDNELDFFMKLIRKFNYKTVNEDFSLTSDMKNILDERLQENTSTYVPAKEALNKIRSQNGL